MTKDEIGKILYSPVFEEAYKNYRDECEGLAMMAPSSHFEGELEGAHKQIVRHLVQHVLEGTHGN